MFLLWSRKHCHRVIWGLRCEKIEERERTWDFYIFLEHLGGSLPAPWARIRGLPLKLSVCANARFHVVSWVVFRPSDTRGKKWWTHCDLVVLKRKSCFLPQSACSIYFSKSSNNWSRCSSYVSWERSGEVCLLQLNWSWNPCIYSLKIISLYRILGFCFFRNLKMFIHCLLAYIVFNKESAIILIFVCLYVTCPFLLAGFDISFYPWSQATWLWCDSISLMLEVHPATYICGFVVFIKFGIFSAIVLQIDFLFSSLGIPISLF